MKWITREQVRIDRVSCTWLILSFCDPEAEMIYVPTQDVLRVAEETGAIPFDLPGVEMGHHGDECSFDAILKAHGPDDEALYKLAAIVRGADTPNKDLTPESRGLDSIAHGFKRLAAAGGYDDRESIRRQWHMYNALYLFCGGDPKAISDPRI